MSNDFRGAIDVIVYPVAASDMACGRHLWPSLVWPSFLWPLLYALAFFAPPHQKNY